MAAGGRGKGPESIRRDMKCQTVEASVPSCGVRVTDRGAFDPFMRDDDLSEIRALPVESDGEEVWLRNARSHAPGVGQFARALDESYGERPRRACLAEAARCSRSSMR